MSIENPALGLAIDLDSLCPTDQLWTTGETEPTSFIELILIASECSEDEGEVRDLVDVLFQSERLQLSDLREDRIPAS